MCITVQHAYAIDWTHAECQLGRIFDWSIITELQIIGQRHLEDAANIWMAVLDRFSTIHTIRLGRDKAFLSNTINCEILEDMVSVSLNIIGNMNPGKYITSNMLLIPDNEQDTSTLADLFKV